MLKSLGRNICKTFLHKQSHVSSLFIWLYFHEICRLNLLNYFHHTLNPIHTTGDIAHDNPRVVERPCPWITVCHQYATLRVSG